MLSNGVLVMKLTLTSYRVIKFKPKLQAREVKGKTMSPEPNHLLVVKLERS
ncbi:MAG: hypothetical protein JWM68_4990, partial [Verrucomicrobiales bacterium]|nr:hypothetical protein [Verrucomicrobiales bacterium]